MQNLIGTEIKGYQINDEIGEGGMGKVYRAHQSTIGREVAFKVIKQEFANQPEFIRRFETEAQIIARLEHTHIVPLYDYWRDPDGAYLVMRLLRGGSLKDLLKSGAVDLETTASLLDQIASALTFAHRGQVVHRDIKPANILLDDSGDAFLTDFGIAKDLQQSDTGDTTGDGLMGSPDYLAPEQARAEPVTSQTDIYSLGVVIYELLTGQHPFPGRSTIERMFAHLNEDIPEITTLGGSVNANINKVIATATAKDPEHRYPDVLAFAAAFREAAALGVSRVEPSLVELLTPREQEILKFIVEGRSNREIADTLVLEVSTVKWHINQLYRKLSVRSRVQATVKARELNLIVDGWTAADTSTSRLQLPEPENPYKGLQAFGIADEQDFFGRERMIRKLLRRLGDDHEFARFQAIVGPSGSGKSSLVRAGLIPALWRGELEGSDNWYIIDMLPGTRPLDELEVALTRIAADQGVNLREHLARDKAGLLRAAGLILPDDGSELLLVVDQFEEIFTLVEDEDERQHFLDLLHAAVTEPRSRVRVIVTLRADFYDRPLHYPGIGTLIQNRTETVLPLGAEELEQAIARPADRVGVMYEEGLVSSIIDDVHYQPGALPLLQYALTELFEQRENRTLTHEGYQAIGGAVGALAARAEQVFNEFDESGQEAIRQMFLRLVTLGEGVEDTRRRVTRRELLDIAQNSDVMDEVIDTYAAYRLLSLDHDLSTRRPTVEVAHEALLREWDRLREWLNESRNDIRSQREVARAAQRWLEADRNEGFLIPGGARLEQFETWYQNTRLALTQNEVSFIETSLGTAARQIQTRRNLQRSLIGALVVGLIVAVGLSIFAFGRQRAAQAAQQAEREQRELAENNFARAESQRLAAESTNQLLRVRSPEMAALLALRGLAVGYTPEADIALQRAAVFDYGRVMINLLGPTAALGFSPDGQFTYSFYFNGDEVQEQAIMWDTVTGEVVWDDPHYWMDGHPRYTADGQHMLAISTDWDWTGLIDPMTRERVLTLDDGSEEIVYAVMSTDGSIAATSTTSGILRLWDSSTGDLLHQIDIGVEGLSRMPMAFSPDDSQIVLQADGITHVWDTSTGDENFRLEHDPVRLSFPYFSANGDMMLQTGRGTLLVWDMRTGERIEPARPFETSINGYAISPDGRLLAYASDTIPGDVAIVDIRTGAEIRRLIGHVGTVNNIEFSSDGTRLVSSSADTTVRMWDVQTGEQMQMFRGVRESVGAVQFLPGDRAILGGSRIWDIDPSLDNSTLPDAVRGIYVPSPDGQTILTASLDGNEFVLLDAETGSLLHTLEGTVTFNYTQSRDSYFWFSEDSQTIVAMSSLGESQAIVRFDTRTGDRLSTWENPDGSYWYASYVPGTEKIFATGTEGGYLLDASTGEQLAVFPAPMEIFNWQGFLSVSPNGMYAAAFTPAEVPEDVDRGLHVWNLETGELIDAFFIGYGVIEGIGFSHDSRYLAYGGVERVGHVYDIQAREEIYAFPHTHSVTGVAFSPDDSTLLTASLDGTATLWDLETGEVVRRFYGDVGGVAFVDFSEDGETALINLINGEGIIEVPVHIEALIDDVCGRVLLDLDEEERAVYGLDDSPTCPKFETDSDDAPAEDPSEGRLPGRVPVAALTGVGLGALGIILRRT